jgi:hypothetical protein
MHDGRIAVDVVAVVGRRMMIEIDVDVGVKAVDHCGVPGFGVAAFGGCSFGSPTRWRRGSEVKRWSVAEADGALA